MTADRLIDTLIAQYGLAPTEAAPFAAFLNVALETAGPALSTQEQARRAQRLADINANLAIESLALTPEEHSFFLYIDQLNLPPARADEILDRYAFARARSVPVAALGGA